MKRSLPGTERGCSLRTPDWRALHTPSPGQSKFTPPPWLRTAAAAAAACAEWGGEGDREGRQDGMRLCETLIMCSGPAGSRVASAAAPNASRHLLRARVGNGQLAWLGDGRVRATAGTRSTRQGPKCYFSFALRDTPRRFGTSRGS